MSIGKSLLWDKLGINDEISLIQQLWETYGEEANTGTLVFIENPKAEKYVQQSPDVCGFRNEETLKRLKSSKSLSSIDSKTHPYFDKVIEAKIYKTSIDWVALREYSGRLHDREADQPYGQFKQKQIVKEALIREVDKTGIKEITVTEKILGNFSDHVALAQQIRGQDSPDCHIRFIETLRLLEKENFLEIQDIQFNFDAVPSPIEKEMDRLEAGVFIDEDAYFYPAEHCLVSIRIKQLTPTEEIIKKQEAEQAIRPTSFTPKSVLPVNPSAEKIFRSFSPQNYPFILMVIRGILSLTDFSPDGKVHYQLQSSPGQLLINERSLLNKLNVEGLFSYYGEDEIFGIVALGNINADVLREVESYLINATRQPKPKPADVIDDLPGRRGLEKKRDVLQSIWTIYQANSNPDSLLVPIADLTIKNRSVEIIDGVIEGLSRSGCFSGWERRDRWYNLSDINHEKLREIFSETKVTYEKSTHRQLEQGKIESQEETIQSETNQPYCITENDCGFLKFGKFGKKKKIGRANSRHFRLLQCLIENLGVAKTIDSVFDTIRLPKDSNDSSLFDWNTGKNRRIEIIRNSIKELQKGNKLEHRIKIELNKQNAQIKALFVK